MKMNILFIIIILIFITAFTGCATFSAGNKEMKLFNKQTSGLKDLRYIEGKAVLTRVDAAYLFMIFFPEKVVGAVFYTF